MDKAQHHQQQNPSDDEGLIWDELNHQQSREIRQHLLGNEHKKPSANINMTSAIKSAMHQTAAIFKSHATTTTSAASIPYRTRDGIFNENGYNNLDEFGLNNESSLSSLTQLEQTSISSPVIPCDESSTDAKYAESNPAEANFILLNEMKKNKSTNAKSNLDEFLTSIYNYYYHRGFTEILCKKFIELVSLFFTLAISIFVFAYVDWKALVSCKDELTCRASLVDYIIKKPFSSITPYNFLILLYTTLFIIYSIFTLFTTYTQIQHAFSSKLFYENQLGIPNDKLEGGAVEWDEIISKIIQLQQSGEYRIAIVHGEELDALRIAMRIMRKDNWIVLLINTGVLDFTLDIPGCGFLKNLTAFSLGKTLEWSLHFCLLGHIYNHKYQIRPTFYIDPSSLRRRFILCGIFQALFMPFLILFMTLYFFLANVHEIRTNTNDHVPYDWSNLAKWTFREFNELPHQFERRLAPTPPLASSYLKQFSQSTMISSLGRIITFLSGSLLAILLSFGTLNDSILLHVKISSWNLLWYVGILGAVFAFGKSLLPDEKIHPPYMRNLYAIKDEALKDIASHTHYLPERWRKRGWQNETKTEFGRLFQSKIGLFIHEILSVVITPLILCISFPQRAEHICNMVRMCRMEVRGVGDVAGFSTFDFDEFQDEDWEGKRIEAGSMVYDGSTLNEGNERINFNKRNAHPKTRFGKMEKSFFSFKAAHKSWKCHSSGQTLIDRVEKYQQEAYELGLAKERQHHIEAAARQLETLLHLEQEQKRNQEQQGFLNDAANIKEGYYSVPRKENERENDGLCDEKQRQSSPSDGTPNTDNLLSNSRSFLLPSKDHESSPFVTTKSASKPQNLHPITNPNSSTNLAGLFTSSAISPQMNRSSAVLHYADGGLSTELRRILNQSTLDMNSVMNIGGISAMSQFGGIADRTGGQYGASSLASLSRQSLLLESNAESDNLSVLINADDTCSTSRSITQYMWLDRYHSHLADLVPQQQPRDGDDGSYSLTRGEARSASASSMFQYMRNISEEEDEGDTDYTDEMGKR